MQRLAAGRLQKTRALMSTPSKRVYQQHSNSTVNNHQKFKTYPHTFTASDGKGELFTEQTKSQDRHSNQPACANIYKNQTVKLCSKLSTNRG